MNFPSTITDGQGGGSFAAAYSAEVFLTVMISAPNSCAARRAASWFADHRFPMGSFAYKVIMRFCIIVSSLRDRYPAS
jgi:hypothetical protein